MVRKPTAEASVRNAEESRSVTLPISVPFHRMEGQSESLLAMGFRRIREIVLDGQGHHASGRIVVEFNMENGLLLTNFAVGPRWVERLGK